MSEATLCDGCGKVETGDRSDWLSISENHAAWTFLAIGHTDKLRHACSWKCVADIALDRADMFEQLPTRGEGS